MLLRVFVAIAASVVVLPGAPLAAQLDPSLDPQYGTVELRTGVAQAPHVTNVRAGGSVDARRALSTVPIGTTGDALCRGHVAAAPDLRLDYAAEDDQPLIIRALSQVDNTLIVIGPDGTWHCDHESGGGSDAMLRFERPQSGRYAIWVGAFLEASVDEPARIEISALETVNGASGERARLERSLLDLSERQHALWEEVRKGSVRLPDGQVVFVSRGDPHLVPGVPGKLEPARGAEREAIWRQLHALSSPIPDGRHIVVQDLPNGRPIMLVIPAAPDGPVRTLAGEEADRVWRLLQG